MKIYAKKYQSMPLKVTTIKIYDIIKYAENESSRLSLIQRIPLRDVSLMYNNNSFLLISIVYRRMMSVKIMNERSSDKSHNKKIDFLMSIEV